MQAPRRASMQTAGRDLVFARHVDASGNRQVSDVGSIWRISSGVNNSESNPRPAASPCGFSILRAILPMTRGKEARAPHTPDRYRIARVTAWPSRDRDAGLPHTIRKADPPSIGLTLGRQHSCGGPRRRFRRFARIQHQHGFALCGDRVRDRQADHTSAHHNHVAHRAILHDLGAAPFVLL